MEINDELTLKIASVARLELTDDELKEFTPDLNEVLNAFSKIQEIDTEGVEPSFQPVVIRDRLRKDEAEECLSQEEALSQTSHKKNGFFTGPKAV